MGPPQMGVQGVGIMEDEAEPNPIVPTPWCLFGFFLGIQKEARPAGRNPCKTSPGGNGSITSGLRAADIQPVVHFPDDLPSPHVQVGVDDLHLMPPAGELLGDVGDL